MSESAYGPAAAAAPRTAHRGRLFRKYLLLTFILRFGKQLF